MDAVKRFQDLVKTAQSPQLPPTLPLEKYLELLNDMHKISIYYAENGQDDEKAYILNLRYVSIVVEELPKHTNFCALPSSQRVALDRQVFEFMAKSDELKRRIMLKYELEHQKEKNEQLIGTIVPSTSSGSSRHNKPPKLQLNTEHVHEDEQQLLSPYVQCQCLSFQTIKFQLIIIPYNILALFMAHACPSIPTTSSDGGPAQLDPSAIDPQFRIAILYGRILDRASVISHLLPCKADAFNKKHFRHYLVAVDPSTGEKNMPIVGFICSSLEIASKLELFQNCQSQIPEMVCIVCSPGHKNIRVLHLVNMFPGGGGSAFHKTSCRSFSASSTCAHLHMTEANAFLVTSEKNATLLNADQRTLLRLLNGEESAGKSGEQQLAHMPATSSENFSTDHPPAKKPQFVLPRGIEKVNSLSRDDSFT